MFSMRTKINNDTILYLMGRNVKTISYKPYLCEYRYVYARISTLHHNTENVTYKKGRVIHNRDTGMEELLIKILSEVKE